MLFRSSRCGLIGGNGDAPAAIRWRATSSICFGVEFDLTKEWSSMFVARQIDMGQVSGNFRNAFFPHALEHQATS